DVLARLSVPVPERVVRRVLRHGHEPPVPARPSASVVLLRAVPGPASAPVPESGPGPGSVPVPGLEVYLLHRHAAMEFAPSMVVFPGGGVDPADTDAADSVLACAVRELAEETGVRVDPAALLPWAHWITPEVEPLRYDTRFFVAVAPGDQEPADISGETTTAGWADPAETLAAHRRGELGLMPPTLSILTELAELGAVPAVLAAARDRGAGAVRPVPERFGEHRRFR